MGECASLRVLLVLALPFVALAQCDEDDSQLCSEEVRMGVLMQDRIASLAAAVARNDASALAELNSSDVSAHEASAKVKANATAAVRSDASHATKLNSSATLSHKVNATVRANATAAVRSDASHATKLNSSAALSHKVNATVAANQTNNITFQFLELNNSSIPVQDSSRGSPVADATKHAFSVELRGDGNADATDAEQPEATPVKHLVAAAEKPLLVEDAPGSAETSEEAPIVINGLPFVNILISQFLASAVFQIIVVVLVMKIHGGVEHPTCGLRSCLCAVCCFPAGCLTLCMPIDEDKLVGPPVDFSTMSQSDH